MNESEAPEVKSMDTALPSAVFGGQLPVSLISERPNRSLGTKSYRLSEGCKWCMFEQLQELLPIQLLPRRRERCVISFSRLVVKVDGRRREAQPLELALDCILESDGT